MLIYVRAHGILPRKRGPCMVYTATALRKSIYTVLDSVLESGNPAIIIRNGKRLRIVPDEPIRRLDRLVSHTTVTENADGLPDIHWDEIGSAKG